MCKGSGDAGLNTPTCVCFLTKSTGLSLVESCLHVLERDDIEAPPGLFGTATTFFSYSWTGTRLVDQLESVEDVVAAGLANPTPFFW